MGDKGNIHKILVGSSKGKGDSGDLGIDGKIKLKIKICSCA
jgi:hypothetical protein